LYSEIEEEAILKWQKEWEKLYEGSHNETVFPQHTRQA
jgi:hypothetical protein